MSVELLVLTKIVEEGGSGLRRLFQAGVSEEDFVSYEEEFLWIQDRISTKQTLNVRTFRRKFPEIEWHHSGENLVDLLVDLKKERAFIELRSLIESTSEQLDFDNAMQMAESVKDLAGQIARIHAPHSDHSLVADWKEHIKEQRQLRKLRDAGHTPGVPTGLIHLDHHWDGLVPGRMILVLGRPGDAKSFLLALFAATCIKNKMRVVMFSPEMNKREHMCRIHTLLSALPDVKQALGLKNSFRNRALMTGVGYNLKSYQQFCRYVDETLGGEVHLVTNQYRRGPMTPGYIEAKVADLNPELVLIDPIYKVKSTRKRESPYHELMDVSNAMQELAESYHVPVVVTNQAHRQQQGKGARDDAPHKDSSFGSDVPTQEAAHVIGVKNVTEEKTIKFRCSKSRFGENFRFEARFIPNTGVFKELSMPETNYYNGKDDDVEDEELKEIIAAAGVEV